MQLLGLTTLSYIYIFVHSIVIIIVYIVTK